mgnify:FL=1
MLFRSQLVRSGSVRTGTLGVAVVDAAPGSADAPGGGARIVRLVAGGAAEAAGLAPDDVVTAVDGAPVGSAEGLAGALYAHPPGTACTLTVDRDGVTLVTGATLGS